MGLRANWRCLRDSQRDLRAYQRGLKSCQRRMRARFRGLRASQRGLRASRRGLRATQQSLRASPRGTDGCTDVQTYEWMNRISPHSTRLCPLLEPLPKNQAKAYEGICGQRTSLKGLRA